MASRSPVRPQTRTASCRKDSPLGPRDDRRRRRSGTSGSCGTVSERSSTPTPAQRRSATTARRPRRARRPPWRGINTGGPSHRWVRAADVGTEKRPTAAKTGPVRRGIETGRARLMTLPQQDTCRSAGTPLAEASGRGRCASRRLQGMTSWRWVSLPPSTCFAGCGPSWSDDDQEEAVTPTRADGQDSTRCLEFDPSLCSVTRLVQLTRPLRTRAAPDKELAAGSRLTEDRQRAGPASASGYAQAVESGVDTRPER
jgi:hypothetical protein